MIGRKSLVWLFGLVSVGIVVCLVHQSAGWSRLVASSAGEGSGDISGSLPALPLAPQTVTMGIFSVIRSGLCYQICVWTKSDRQVWPGLKVSFTVTSGPTKGQKCSGVTDKFGMFCCEICSEGAIAGIDHVVMVCEDAKEELDVDWELMMHEVEDDLTNSNDCHWWSQGSP